MDSSVLKGGEKRERMEMVASVAAALELILQQQRQEQKEDRKVCEVLAGFEGEKPYIVRSAAAACPLLLLSSAASTCDEGREAG